MSGPKVDTAKIRQQEFARLMNARKERFNLAESIQNFLHEVETCPDTVEIDRKELQHLLKQVKRGNELLDTQSIRDTFQAIVKEFRKEVQHQQRKADSLKNAHDFTQLQRESQKFQNAHQSIIRRMSEQTPQEIQTISLEEVQQQYQAFEEEITAFLKQEHLNTKHKNTILLLYHDLQQLQNTILLDEKSRKLQRLYQEYSKISAQIRNEMEYLSSAYEEYCQECFDLAIPLKNITEFSSVEEIQTATEEARKIAENQISREYIRRQIDEVMSKHGYEIVSSQQLHETDNQQMLYGVGDDTAIHVFVSEEQQVTMRVVGIGFDEEITEEEDETLFQKQCAFCQMHPEITAELALRGVILQTKKHMPPDKRFNKKIRTHSGKEKHSGTKSKKQQKYQELKTMRKEI